MLKHAELQDPRLLRLFLTVADSGGVSAAERRLNLSRSTISTNLAELEARLGLSLCKRGPGGFALTEAGHAVYAAAAEWLAAGDRLGEQLASLQHQRLTGELRIGFCDSSLSHPDFCFANVLRAFRQKAPEARLAVTSINANAVADALAGGDIHLGLAPIAVKQAQFYSKRLYAERHQLYGTPDHPQRNAGAQALAKADFVGTGQQWSPQHRALVERLQPCASAPELEARAALILSGTYLGFLPTHMAEPFVAAGRLVAVAAPEFSYELDMGVHCLSANRANPLIQQLFSQLNDGHYVQTAKNQ